MTISGLITIGTVWLYFRVIETLYDIIDSSLIITIILVLPIILITAIIMTITEHKAKNNIYIESNINNECNENDNIETIKIKYFDNEIDKIEKISNGDWVDLRSAETIDLKKGEFYLIPLGIGMKLPTGYEANVVPRSSTYKNFKVIQTNSFAVIDNSYSGNNDQWFYPVIAMEDTTIHKNERICQFRINKTQPELIFEEVECLDDINRGGFGSTGTN